MNKYILVQRIGNKWEIIRRLETRQLAIKWLKVYRKLIHEAEYRVVKELY